MNDAEHHAKLSQSLLHKKIRSLLANKRKVPSSKVAELAGGTAYVISITDKEVEVLEALLSSSEFSPDS